jgi:hypothetical protein
MLGYFRGRERLAHDGRALLSPDPVIVIPAKQDKCRSYQQQG